MRRWLVLGMLLLAGRADAQAPAAPETPELPNAVRSMVGAWEFANAARDKVCTVRFRTDRAAHGMKVEFEPTCVRLFAFLAEVTGWTIADNDFLRLVDAAGRSVLEFSEVENAVYEAPRQGEGILFIQKPVAADVAPRTARDLSGEWIIARGSRTPLCTLVLTGEPSGEDFAVRVQQPCDPSVTRFGPNAWRLDRDELVLKSARGQVWRFEETEPRSWRRMPATAVPFLLLRK